MEEAIQEVQLNLVVDQLVLANLRPINQAIAKAVVFGRDLSETHAMEATTVNATPLTAIVTETHFAANQ